MGLATRDRPGVNVLAVDVSRGSDAHMVLRALFTENTRDACTIKRSKRVSMLPFQLLHVWHIKRLCFSCALYHFHAGRACRRLRWT